MHFLQQPEMTPLTATAQHLGSQRASELNSGPARQDDVCE
jgi:hypothetical protein